MYLGLVVHTRSVPAPGLEWDWVHRLRVQWGFDPGSMGAEPVFDTGWEASRAALNTAAPGAMIPAAVFAAAYACLRLCSSARPQ